MTRTLTLVALAGTLAFMTTACSNTARPVEPRWVTTDNLTTSLLQAPALAASPAVQAPEDHRLQILISEVRDTPRGPTLVRHGYRLGAEYFYPASTIKLAAAIAACQEIDRLRAFTGLPITLDTPITFDPLFPGESREDADPTNLESSRITTGHEIRKLFIVSDNTAFNWLYDLVGQERLNRAMWEAGLRSVRISHRLSLSRTPEQNRRSRPLTLHSDEGDLTIPSRTSRLDLRVPPIPGLLVGDRYLAGGQTVPHPMAFADKNAISIIDLQDMLIQVVRPDVELGNPGLGLSAEHREFMLEAMRLLPAQSSNPAYDAAKFPDNWVKFLLPGLERVAPREDFVIHNKVGLAYGFLIENAAVTHIPTGRTFFLTACVYANPNGTLNDNTYAYDTVSLPLMADLAEATARALWN